MLKKIIIINIVFWHKKKKASVKMFVKFHLSLTKLSMTENCWPDTVYKCWMENKQSPFIDTNKKNERKNIFSNFALETVFLL